MSDIIHSFDFHPLFRIPAALVGVRDSTSVVEVRGSWLRAGFGPWKVRTPLSNVASATVTGPYAWPKVIGPAHLSLSDRGLTFATNPDREVCISFHTPVTGLDPYGVIRHPNLTVTVAHPAALAELLDLRAMAKPELIDALSPFLDRRSSTATPSGADLSGVVSWRPR